MNKIMTVLILLHSLAEIRAHSWRNIIGSQLNSLQDVHFCGGRVGLVVRALAFHQRDLGSISALGVISGLSLLVLYSAMRGFSLGTPVFPSHQKPTFDLI